MKRMIAMAIGVAALVGGYAVATPKADTYSVLIEGGKHAGQCVSVESFDTGHTNHAGEYWIYTCTNNTN